MSGPRLFTPDDACSDSKCERPKGHAGRHRGEIIPGLPATWETHNIWDIFPDWPQPKAEQPKERRDG